MELQEEVHCTPAMEYVGVWDIFRDLEEDNIQDSEGVIRRQRVSAHQLRKFFKEMRDDGTFIEGAIKRVIDANANNVGSSQSTGNTTPQKINIDRRSKKIELLKCYVRVPREVVAEFERTAVFCCRPTPAASPAPVGDEPEDLAFTGCEPGEVPFGGDVGGVVGQAVQPTGDA